MQLAQQVAQRILLTNLGEGDGDGDAEATEKTAAKLRQFFPGIDIGPAELSGTDIEARVAAAVAATFETKCVELDAVRDGLATESQRFLALTQIDTLWKAHMKTMGYVKDFAGLKAYAQENPLDVYRREGIKLYDSMQVAYRSNTVYSFFMYQPRE